MISKTKVVPEARLYLKNIPATAKWYICLHSFFVARVVSVLCEEFNNILSILQTNSMLDVRCVHRTHNKHGYITRSLMNTHRQKLKCALTREHTTQSEQVKKKTNHETETKPDLH